MAKRKSAKKNQAAGGRKAKGGEEPLVVKLAGRLGTLLGRARSKADGLVERVAVRKQVGQIRDGATQLMNRVNRAGAAVKKRVTKSVTAKKSKGKSTTAVKRRSKGAVDAQGKRHRKPPVEELFDPLLGEPMGKQMGAKDVRRRGGRA